MTEQVQNALLDSIEHWRQNVLLATEGKEISTLAKDCALCALFMSNPLHNFSCKGCPVYEHTKRSGCRGTPYFDVVELEHSSNKLALAEACQEQTDFLRSLLPKQEEQENAE